jgi:calcium permeable stress-gated cation channel
MAGWYNGVLKCVSFPQLIDNVLNLYSTGKKRYGHPALTGSLPQPWLPLKQGQTLVNSQAVNGRGRDHRDHAVVLTLRKRVSMGRRGAGPLAAGGRSIIRDSVMPRRASTALTPVAQNTDEAGEEVHPGNPWHDENGAAPSMRRSLTAPAPTRLTHRLSYDFGSGVIVLPEDTEWLAADDEDDEYEDDESDGDYGTIREEGDAAQGSQEVGPSAADSTEQQSTDEGAVPRPSVFSRSRHRTYFHHPERRRQTIPGAFPNSQ